MSARLAAAAAALLILAGAGAGPAWGQMTPVGPPPLAPPPAPRPPQPPPAPGVQPPPEAAPGEPGAEQVPLPPSQTGILAPRPPDFEYIQQEPLRPDMNLLVNPLAAPKQYYLRGILTEEADDNVRFAQGGQKQGDLSSIATLAGRYRFQTERTYLQTENSISARYSPRFSDRQGVSFANINLLGGHQLTPRFSLGFSEVFASGNDLLQSSFATPTAVSTTVNNGRAEFSRNSFSPQATYLLTEVDTITIRWANTFVTPQGSSGAVTGSTTNTYGAFLSHRLSERTTTTLGYDHLTSKSRGSDMFGDDVTGGLTHALTPITTFVLNASGSFRNNENTPNQNIYGFSVGGSRQVSPTFTVAATVGMQAFQASGQADAKPTVSFSFTKEGVHYRLSGSGSLATSENIGQVNNIGFTRSRILTVDYTYFPSQRLFFTLGGSYARTDFSQAPANQAALTSLGIQQSTIDRVYSLFASADYRFARSLSLRLLYQLTVRDSSQMGRDMSDNRVSLSFVTEISR